MRWDLNERRGREDCVSSRGGNYQKPWVSGGEALASREISHLARRQEKSRLARDLHSKMEKMKKWIAIIMLAAAVGITVVGFSVLQSNTDSADNKQETIVEQPEMQSEGEPEEMTDGDVQDTDEAETTGTIITTGDSEFGPMLFDGDNQAIYIWELEESSTAECYGSCADAWPPVLTDGVPRAEGSVNDELLGTTERTDGTTQVTYNGHPLYYYAHEAPGEVKCHNIRTHGGLWWVIQPNGIRAD